MSRIVRKCTYCGQSAQYVYTAQFRVGETSEGLKMLIGKLGELGETMIPLYVFVCLNCAKVELFGTEELKQQAIKAMNTNRP